MCEGETREIKDADLVADLLRAGYVEEVKPKGRTKKTATEPQE